MLRFQGYFKKYGLNLDWMKRLIDLLMNKGLDVIGDNLNLEGHVFSGCRRLFNVDVSQCADSSIFPLILASKFSIEQVTLCLPSDGGDQFIQGFGLCQWGQRLDELKEKVLKMPIFRACKFLSERLRGSGQVIKFLEIEEHN